MIQAITGHMTLHEVERYTKAAGRAALADAAMGLLVNKNTPTEIRGGSKTRKKA